MALQLGIDVNGLFYTKSNIHCLLAARKFRAKLLTHLLHKQLGLHNIYFVFLDTGV